MLQCSFSAALLICQTTLSLSLFSHSFTWGSFVLSVGMAMQGLKNFMGKGDEEGEQQPVEESDEVKGDKGDEVPAEEPKGDEEEAVETPADEAGD